MGAAKMKKAQVIISSLESIKISDSLNLVFFCGHSLKSSTSSHNPLPSEREDPKRSTPRFGT